MQNNRGEGRLRVLAVSQDSPNTVGFYAGFYLLVRALSKQSDTALLMGRGATMKYGRLPNERRYSIDGPAKSLRYLKILITFLARSHFRFDVMLVNADFSAFQVLILAKLFRIKCCMFLPGVHFYDGPYGKGTKLERFWYRPLSLGTYRYYDALITQTEFYTEHVRRFVRTRHPIRVVGHLIEDSPVILPKEPGLLLSMGVVEEIKRPGVFIEIVKGARTRMGQQVHGAWIGSGTQFKKYSEMAASAGPYIQFIGDLGSGKWNYLSKAQVFLVSATGDTFNIPTGEALNAGTPVVSFRLGGSTEVYGDSITQVAQGNIHAAVEAVCDILTNPSKVEEQLRQWQVRREKYTEKSMGVKLLDVLNGVVRR